MSSKLNNLSKEKFINFKTLILENNLLEIKNILEIKKLKNKKIINNTNNLNDAFLKTDMNGDTLLMVAVQGNNYEIIKELINSGLELNINEINNNGDTALMIAVYNHDNLNIIELLINKGANPTIIGSKKDSPIFFCIAHNYYYTLVELIKFVKTSEEREIFMNSLNRAGKNPLTFATKNNIDDCKIVELLLEKSANLNGVFPNLLTPASLLSEQAIQGSAVPDNLPLKTAVKNYNKNIVTCFLNHIKKNSNNFTTPESKNNFNIALKTAIENYDFIMVELFYLFMESNKNNSTVSNAPNFWSLLEPKTRKQIIEFIKFLRTCIPKNTLNDPKHPQNKKNKIEIEDYFLWSIQTAKAAIKSDKYYKYYNATKYRDRIKYDDPIRSIYSIYNIKQIIKETKLQNEICTFVEKISYKIERYYNLYLLIIYWVKGWGGKFRQDLIKYSSVIKSREYLIYLNNRYYELYLYLKKYPEYSEYIDINNIYDIAVDTNDDTLKNTISKNNTLYKAAGKVVGASVRIFSKFLGTASNIALSPFIVSHHVFKKSISTPVNPLSEKAPESTNYSYYNNPTFYNYNRVFVSNFEELEKYKYNNFLRDEEIIVINKIYNFINRNQNGYRPSFKKFIIRQCNEPKSISLEFVGFSSEHKQRISPINVEPLIQKVVYVFVDIRNRISSKFKKELLKELEEPAENPKTGPYIFLRKYRGNVEISNKRKLEFLNNSKEKDVKNRQEKLRKERAKRHIYNN